MCCARDFHKAISIQHGVFQNVNTFRRMEDMNIVEPNLCQKPDYRKKEKVFLT